MQVTTRKKQLKSKSEAVLQRVRERMVQKADRVVDLLHTVTPVNTGAYSESMHINPRGDTSGAAVSTAGRTRPNEAEKEANRETRLDIMVDRLDAEVSRIEDIEQGFTVVNKAPHAYWVEVKVEPVFAQIKGVL